MLVGFFETLVIFWGCWPEDAADSEVSAALPKAHPPSVTLEHLLVALPRSGDYREKRDLSDQRLGPHKLLPTEMFPAPWMPCLTSSGGDPG